MPSHYSTLLAICLFTGCASEDASLLAAAPGDQDAKAQMISTATYSMSQLTQNYSTSSILLGGAWGYHALQWKAYVANTASYIAPTVGDGTPGESLNINCTHDDTLDDMEDGIPSDYYFDSLGDPDTPPGSWGCVSDTDPAVTAVLAAIAMWSWGSPLYLQYLYPSSNSAFPVYAGVIESITINTQTGLALDAVCGFTRGDTTAMYNQAVTCAANHTFTIDSVDMRMWPTWVFAPTVPSFQATLNGGDFAGYHNTTTSGGAVAIPLIVDPSDDNDVGSLEELWEIAAVIASAVVVEDPNGEQVPPRESDTTAYEESLHGGE